MTLNDFEKIKFEFGGRQAVLVFPVKANTNKNWLLKTEYFGAFPDFEIEMLERGWHLAYISNKTRWCLDDDLDIKKKFADYLIKEYGLYKKCVPVGMSCGGLIGSKYAAKYPEYVSALYLDSPVMNLLSCPADMGIGKSGMMNEFVEATGITASKLICYREHPIDKMDILLKNNIPVIMVYGDSDEIVPYSENGAVLEKYYRDNGGIIECIGKRGCGHHPHGLPDNSVIVQFVEKYSK